MGSCISLHKTLSSSAKPRQWVGCETANKNLIPTPAKNNDQDNNLNHQHFTHMFMSQGNATTFQDHSNRYDEVFFDSQVCLESDCEDFFSVDGDFIPSQGNTPIHESSFIEVQLDKSPDPTIQHSPKDAEKKLSEFLHENLLNVDQVNVTPWETALTGILKPEESDRLTRSISCCLPSLRKSLSIGERKKDFMQTKTSPFLKIRQASIFKKPFHCTWY